MTTLSNSEHFLGYPQEHLIFYVQYYMMNLYAILHMLLKWEFVEENWMWRSKLEYC
jgi:hypothetical protein